MDISSLSDKATLHENMLHLDFFLVKMWLTQLTGFQYIQAAAVNYWLHSVN